MAVAAPSIVSDLANLREVAAALRAFVAAKGGEVNRAFAANLESIAFEIDAAAQPSAAPDRHSLYETARRLSWFALCSDIPTADLLLRLARETEESVSRPAAMRAPLALPPVAPTVPAPLDVKDERQGVTRPALRRWLAGAAMAALAVAVWSLPLPPVPRIAGGEKTVPVSLSAPPAISAAPASPVVATAPATVDASPASAVPVVAAPPVTVDASPPPAASAAPAPPVVATPPAIVDASPPLAASAAPAATEEVAPRLSDAGAAPPPAANSEAASAPKPHRAAWSAPAGETPSRMTRVPDAAGTAKTVPSPAPPSAAHAQEARMPGVEASTPRKMQRAARPEPADDARALMQRELGLVGGARTDVVPPEAPKE